MNGILYRTDGMTWPLLMHRKSTAVFTSFVTASEYNVAEKSPPFSFTSIRRAKRRNATQRDSPGRFLYPLWRKPKNCREIWLHILPNLGSCVMDFSESEKFRFRSCSMISILRLYSSTAFYPFLGVHLTIGCRAYWIWRFIHTRTCKFYQIRP